MAGERSNLDYILSIDVTIGNLVEQLKAAQQALKEVLTQTAEVKIDLRTTKGKETQATIKALTQEVKSLEAALQGVQETAVAAIPNLDRTMARLEDQAAGSSRAVRQVLVDTGDLTKARQKLEYLYKKEQAHKLGVPGPKEKRPSLDVESAMQVTRKRIHEVRADLQGLQSAIQDGLIDLAAYGTHIEPALQGATNEIRSMARAIDVAFDIDLSDEEDSLETIIKLLKYLEKGEDNIVKKAGQLVTVQGGVVRAEESALKITEKRRELFKQLIADLAASDAEARKSVGNRKKITDQVLIEREAQHRILTDIKESQKLLSRPALLSAPGIKALPPGRFPFQWVSQEERDRQAAIAAQGVSTTGTGPGTPGFVTNSQMQQTLGMGMQSMLRTFYRDRPGFAKLGERSMQELSRDLQALDKTMRRLDLLELQAAELPGDSPAYKDVTRQIVRLQREQVAMEQSFINSLLSGKPAVESPRLVRGQPDQLQKDAAGNLVTEMVTQPQAYRRMRKFFQASLGEAFTLAIIEAQSRVSSLRGVDDKAANKYAAFNITDFLQGLQGSGDYAKLVADAMATAGKNSQTFVAENQKALGVFNGITTEIDDQTRRLRVLAAVESLRTERAQRLAGYYRAIRGLSYTIGGFALGITAGQKFRESFTSSLQLEQEVAGIRGILPRRSAVDAETIRSGIVDLSRQYGADLIETARAAKLFAQAGLNAQEVIRELDVTLVGMRGMGIAIEQMQEFQIAIRAVSDEEDRIYATARALDKISRVEAKYAVTPQDLIDTLRLASPVIKQVSGDMTGLSDAVDYTIGLSTVMIEQLRISGNEAGNALKFIISRLASPEVLRKLQDVFGLEIALGGSGGQEFLPFGDILKEIVGTYRELTPAAKQQFAVLLAGGRRVNTAITFLEGYDRVLEVAKTSSEGFGDIQERTALQLDTLQSKLQITGQSFKVFVDQLNRTTAVGKGLGVVLTGLNGILGVATAAPGGSLLAGLGVTAVGSLGAGVIKQSYKKLDVRRLASSIIDDTGKSIDPKFLQSVLDDAAYQAQFAGVGALEGYRRRPAPEGAGRFAAGTGALATSPTAIIIASILTTLFTIGAAKKVFDYLNREDKFRVQPKTLADLGYFESTQFQEFQRRSRDAGFTSADQALTEIRNAVSGGQALRDVLSQYGANSPEQLLRSLKTTNAEGDQVFKLPQELRDEFPRLRENIVQAFLEDIPEGTNNLSDMADEAQRVAAATRLISEAALASSVSINRMLADLQEAGESLRVEVTNQVTAESLSNLYRTPVSGTTSEGLTTSLAFNPDKVKTEFVNLLGVFGEGLFDEATPYGKALGENLSSIVDDVVVATDTFGTALGKMIHYIETSNTNLARETKVQLRTQLQLRADEILLGNNPQIAALFNQSVTPPASTPGELSGTLGRLISDAVNAAVANRRAQLSGSALERFDNIIDRAAIENMKLEILDTTTALSGFRDKLLEFFLEAASRLRQIDTDATIARTLGLDFDRPQQEFDVARELMSGISTLRGTLTDEIIKDSQRIQSMAISDRAREQLQNTLGITRSQEAPEITELADQADTLGNELANLLNKREAFRTEISSFFEAGRGIESILPDIPEAQDVIRQFRELEQLFNTTGFDVNALKAFEESFTRMAKAQRGILLTRQRDIQLMEFQSSVSKGLIQAEFGRLDLITTRGDRLLAEYDIQKRIFEIEQANLYGRLRTEGGGISEEDKLELSRNAQEFLAQQITSLGQIQVELGIDGTVFQQQIRDNIKQALSGVSSVIADPTVFANLTNSLEKGFGGAAKDFADALISPAANTWASRLAENFTEALAQSLQDNDFVKDLFASPEIRMRDEMIHGGEIASKLMFNAIVLAGKVNSGALTPEKAAQQLGDIPGSELPGDVGGFKKELLYPVAGQISGALLGGAVARAGNRDNRFVGTGSSLGSAIGLAVSGGNPLGALLGGAFGGLLGGFVGDEKKEETASAQLQTLEAIERAQIETINAIVNQTEALLDPQNRLINLPTNFNVPAYNPGASGAMTETYNFDFSGMTISGEVATPDLQQAIQDAVVQGISESRRVTSRATRRF